MTKGILFTLALSLTALTACHQDSGQYGGDTVGNGGDEVALDFLNASRKALEYIALNPEVGDRVNVNEMRRKIDLMNVNSTDTQLVLNGETKTAVNYPSGNRVEINRPRWKSIDPEIKPALALHECLGLMGIADKNYILSSELLDADPLTLKTLRGKADILIVIDDSGSMASHQANLSEHVDRLWNRIRERRLDFKIAVITSSADNHGRFIGNVKVITPHTPNGLDYLRNNIRAGTNGDGIEQFFGPVTESLKLPENQNFLRPSANLELVFLTDADDQTPSLEPNAFATYLWNLKGDPKKVFAYGIIALMPTTNCTRDTGEPIQLIKFVSLVQGDLHDMCNLSADIPAAIGAKIVNHIAP